MTIAIVLAGGNKRIDERGVPVQFINVFDKPILVYTLDGFQQHPQIDAICVVCMEGWKSAVYAYGKQYNISKLKWVFDGGETVQTSILNGITSLNDIADTNDIIIIHDGNRPMIDRDILTDVIRVTKKKGNAITATAFKDQMFFVDEDDDSVTNSYVDRDTIRKVTTPQGYIYSDLIEAYSTSQSKNMIFEANSYTDTMMATLGKTLYFASGSDQNIKLESRDDILLFKALLESSQSEWIK